MTSFYQLLEDYPHVRYINVSKNELTDLQALEVIQHLMVLNAAKNNIASLNGFSNRANLHFLEIVNLSHNQITTLGPLALPNLRKLNLNDNQISDCSTF